MIRNTNFPSGVILFPQSQNKKEKPINIHLLIPHESWSCFFQPRFWQLFQAVASLLLHCCFSVASKQPISLTIKGKFLDNSLLSWKGELFFLILWSEHMPVSKQQWLGLWVWPSCRGTSSLQLRLAKRFAWKTPILTHHSSAQLLPTCF